MSRLVINPGTPQAWEIHLRPGANSLGRSQANDFEINDPSVSGSHCEIVVEEGSALLRDAGSTNGTFVGDSQIREEKLEHGQAIRLGSVGMIYYTDAPSAPKTNGAAAPRSVIRLTPSNAAPVVARIIEAMPAVPINEETVAPAEIVTGASYCRYHPTLQGRHYCPKCTRTFCDLCVNSSVRGDRTMRTCRTCAVEAAPFEFRAAPTKSFYAKLPEAFGYPFKGAGIIILVFATIAFAALNFISAGILGIFIKIGLYGFVFLFMQNIILSTTSDEKAELSFPEISSLFGAALQFGGTVLASFWLALALEIAKLNGVEIPSEAIMASVILGGLYFPMALLVVAMKDTALAGNPLIVIPAIMKVPAKYSVTAGLTLLVFGIRKLGMMVSGGAGRLALHTHDTNAFMVAVVYQMVWALLSVYLLTVTMRILGLFYNSSKQELGWYSS